MPAGAQRPQAVAALFDAAFNSGDVHRLMEIFARDATMRLVDGTCVGKGNDLRDVFTTMQTTGATITNSVRLCLESADVALLLLDWTIRTPSGDTQVEQSGTATQVVTRETDGLWRLRVSNPMGCG